MQDKNLDKQIEVLKHINEKLADIIEYLAKAEQPNLFIQFACLKLDSDRDLASIRAIRRAVNNSI